jgi:hypothetical protein
MAQAERITTAIRELMSRGRPPKSTNPVRAAHTEYVAALAGNVPHPIHSDGDSADLEGRADHSQRYTSISPLSSPTPRTTSQAAASIAGTSTTYSRTCRPTRWA